MSNKSLKPSDPQNAAAPVSAAEAEMASAPEASDGVVVAKSEGIDAPNGPAPAAPVSHSADVQNPGDKKFQVKLTRRGEGTTVHDSFGIDETDAISRVLVKLGVESSRASWTCERVEEPAEEPAPAA